MRITAANAYESSIATLQRRQQGMSEAQAQLTSGKRVLRASDDPAAAARAERALAQMQRSEANQRALDASRNMMQLSETALGDAGELLQQARELVMQAGNGTHSDSERRSLGEALRSVRRDLLSVANRTDGAGRYLFAGQGSDSPPLVDGAGGVSFVGTAGVLRGDAGEPLVLSVDGRAAWLEAVDPADPDADLSIFSALDRIADELLTAGRSRAEVAQTVSSGLAEIDASASNISSWRSRAGEALNRFDGIEVRIGQRKLDAQTERSQAEDLDMVQAISDFQSKQSGYDAALKTYSMVQRMTLFEYLR
jgi:flagellar hook-associated protein 3 FlgL